jgi:hypothetical protein
MRELKFTIIYYIFDKEFWEELAVFKHKEMISKGKY